MSVTPLKHNAIDIIPENIPQFKEKQLELLSVRIDTDFPEEMNTLRDRVESFQLKADTLNASIKSHNNISLIRLIGTVILVAGGSLGLICGSLPVGITLLTASFLLMSLGTLYLNRADAQLSNQVECERTLGSALDQELHEASQFWNERGDALVQLKPTNLEPEQQQMIQQIQKGQQLKSFLGKYVQ